MTGVATYSRAAVASSDHSSADRDSNNRSNNDSRTNVHTAADQHTRPDQHALGAAQLRDDRRELAHRVARHRDVAEAQTLAPLEEQLA